MPSIYIDESVLVLIVPESFYQVFRFDTFTTFVDVSKLTVAKCFEHIIRAKEN